MLRSGSKFIVIVMLVFATGGQWFVLQSFAWVQMTIANARTASLGNALEKTFSGQHPCQLCKLVKRGKAAEQKREQGSPQLKIDFQLDAGTAVIEPPRPFQHVTPFVAAAELRAHAPALPPPRHSFVSA